MSKVRKARLLKITLLVTVSVGLFGITGCKDKNKEQEVIIKETGINRLDLSGNIMRLQYSNPVELGIDESDNNGTVKIGEGGKVLSYGNNGKSLGMGELILTGNDKTEYYIIDGNDIIYDGVRFKGLNEALDKCKAPYEKQNMVNFIVKTFNPPHYVIDCTYENDELDTDDMNSVSVDASLEAEYNGYASIVNKYGGKRATWRINMYDDSNMRLRASLVGNDKFIIFRGDKNVANIDMESLAYVKPRFFDIPEYLIENSDTNENNVSSEGSDTETYEITEFTDVPVDEADLYSSVDSDETFEDMISRDIINSVQ